MQNFFIISGALSIQPKISKKGTDGKEFSLGKLPENTKKFEFPKGELFIREILEIPGRKAIGTVLPFEKFSRILVFLARLSSIPEI